MTVDDVKELIKTMSKSDVGVMEYESDGTKLYLEKNVAGNVDTTRVVNIPKNVVSTQNDINDDAIEEGNIITSPLVGTVYLTANEGGENFVEVGDQVEKGQVIAIVEAMKLMNEIESEYSGAVKEILVSNGQTVEYGQPLLIIE